MKRMRMYDGAERTFEEGVEEYILDMKARNLRDGTINHYRQSTKQIYKRVPPETAISSFSKKTIDDFYVALREDKNLNDVSMGTYARDLKTLMRFFMKKGYLPHFDIPIPKADKQPIETYTDEELKRLLKKPDVNKCNFANYRTWVIICLLLSTGMRQNSLINLRVKDIDFDNGVIYVRITKNRKPLIVPLNGDILRILAEYLKYRKADEDEWLFCNSYGEKLTKSTCYHGIFDYCKARGSEHTGVHRFRHTFAKKWIVMGGSVVSLQKILGHSSLAITENYINLLTTDLKKDAEEINIIRSFNSNHISMRR